MQDYHTKMKNLAEKLKLVWNPIPNSDITIQTMNGLES